jgi:hypothetical protein
MLITWNCKHIGNPNKLPHIQRVNALLGLETPALVTPLELLENNNENERITEPSSLFLLWLSVAAEEINCSCHAFIFSFAHPLVEGVRPITNVWGRVSTFNNWKIEKVEC